MTRFSFCTLTLALCLAANAATVRTASETFVTNKIAAAIAAIPEPDFSPSNATLVATIEETSPAPGDYATVSNKAMTALQSYTESDPVWESEKGDYATVWDLGDYATVWDLGDLEGRADALEAATNDLTTAIGKAVDEAKSYSDERCGDIADSLTPLTFNIYSAIKSASTAATNYTDSATNGLLRTESDPTISAWAKAASKPTYTAAEVGATTPSDVTAAIREQSLGGIWDAELEVWWTPRMRNGNLTYEATTNVNLNAVN